ncbi:hypothetical protein BT69DRAFT_1289667 [Atractiella rhizophila]|nr:hypothetical protein BT69DRAFT_1289667 [Atractiella rhizophila]
MKEEAFEVVGRREEWDEWYESGNLVENLDDQTSLTYMVMKGIMGSKTRDLSLVERVEVADNGSIYFCTTSIEHPQIPKVSGRIRATISLNGWVLEDHVPPPAPTWKDAKQEPKGYTKIFYYLQVDVKTFVPNLITTKYLARRPLCISRIINYFNKHGSSFTESTYELDYEGEDDAPEGTELEKKSSVSSSIKHQESIEHQEVISDESYMVEEKRKRRKSTRRDSASRKKEDIAPSLAESALPVPTPRALTIFPVASVSGAEGPVTEGLEKFSAAIDLKTAGWKKSFDVSESAIWTKSCGDGKMPMVKGESIVKDEEEEISTESVLGVILSHAARRVWDQQWVSSALVKGQTDEDKVLSEIWKGVFPHLDNRFIYLRRGIHRSDVDSLNGAIDIVSCSVPAKRASSTAFDEVHFSGFRLEPLPGGGVSVVHANHHDPTDRSLNAAVIKVLATSIAQRPKALNECINKYGYPPHFVRWEEGGWNLTDDGGNVEDGELWFQAEKSEGGEAKDQKCWLKWSQRMYPRGINISVANEDVIADVSIVKGLQRVVQLTWNPSFSDGKVKLMVSSSSEGRSPSFASFNGQKVESTIDTSVRANDSKPSKSGKRSVEAAPKVTSRENFSSPEPVSPPLEKSFLPPPLPVKSAADSSSVPSGLETSSGSTRARSTSRSDVETLDNRNSVMPKTPNLIGGYRPPSVATSVTEKALPEDAMLIISKDLYFTRQQVFLMLGMMAFAFLWGKFL